MKYTIEQVCVLMGAHRYGSRSTEISFLLTDSRSLSFPEETMFFALKTERNDGHKYIPELYRRGVRNFVVSTVPHNREQIYADCNFLKVPSPLKALQRLAERHREGFNIPVVGIGGSNGKTMVKEWLYQLLSPEKVVTRSPRSYNSQVGVPLSVWLIDEHTEVALIEAGISEPSEMAPLRAIIQPTVAVLTNVGAPHQENFSSIEEKCEEKLRLFHDAETLVYCEDDQLIASCVERIKHPGKRLSWSLQNAKAPFYVSCIEKTDEHTTISYRFNGEENRFDIPFIDDASVQNAIVSAVVGLHLGLSPASLAQRMHRLEPIAMRLEVKQGQHGCTLINDSYNSDINSLDIALDFMNRRPDHEGRKHTLILSDIKGAAETPCELYAKVSRLLQHRHVDKFIGIGADLVEQQDAIEIKNKFFFTSVKKFLRSQAFKTLQNEVILLKGAREFGFDQLTELMVQKVHETTLEVNLNALVDNLNRYRSFMKQDTKLVCMIKADGYGTGAVEVAKTLQEHRADYLAVAVADEGVTLRKNGITQSIMVMNPEMSSFKTLFDYDLEPEVYSFRLLDALIHAAEKEGITDYPIHIKLDTGMHRLGFDPVTEIPKLIERLKRQSALIPRSVFSHFVGADSQEFDGFSSDQFALFDAASKQLQHAFKHKILRHMDNSAGIEHFPERQMDMCRLGIGLYGVDPLTNHLLENAATLKTTILQIHDVKAGESVGYSRKTILQKDSRIAAIPIGYADGLRRALGNRNGYCIVAGQKADYVGNICMDVAMIDVTDIPCKEGDSVEIFGKQLPVTVLADAVGTISYEILTGISPRVRRVYFQD